MPNATLPDWTNPVPGPQPPGTVNPSPAEPPTATDPGWADWISGIADIAYQTHYPASLYTPQYKASIDKVEIGPVIIVPLEGATPSAWAADGATRESTGILGIDFTRYKRTYPQVKLQKYQSISVTVSIWWGSYFWGHIVGTSAYYCFTRTVVFWQPIGTSWTEGPRDAFRWQQTSRSSQGKVTVQGGGVGVQGDIGLKEFIPNPPPKDPPGGRPDDLDPRHQHPYPELPAPQPQPLKTEHASFSELERRTVSALHVAAGDWSSLVSEDAPEERPVQFGWHAERVGSTDHAWFDRAEIMAAITTERPEKSAHR